MLSKGKLYLQGKTYEKGFYLRKYQVLVLLVCLIKIDILSTRAPYKFVEQPLGLFV